MMNNDVHDFKEQNHLSIQEEHRISGFLKPEHLHGGWTLRMNNVQTSDQQK